VRLAKTTDGLLLFWCPGCRELHGVWVAEPNHLTGGRWIWNGDLDRPTFSPSILVNPSGGRPRCHSHVRDGVIWFLSDCQHDKAGLSLPLPVYPLECGA
jgi:hypothetical protein